MKGFFSTLLITVFLIAGCADTTKTQKGAVIGAATGATAGALIDHHKRGRGALIGAAVGGVTGAYVGKQEDRQDEHTAKEAEIEEQIFQQESEARIRDEQIATEARIRDRENFAATFRSTVYFDSNSPVLNQEGLREVRRAAGLLNQYPDTKVYVKGYADSKGAENYNMTLSRNRAESVKNALEEAGISNSRIFTSGHGSVGNSDMGMGNQLNRKVEITAEP